MQRGPDDDLYSAASSAAAQAPDVQGPDGIRVTLRVEPAVDRLRRWRQLISMPRPVTRPVANYFAYRTLPSLVQKYVLRDRWAVDVEADNGERCRVRADTRDAAVEYARQIGEGVRLHGVAFLKTFAH